MPFTNYVVFATNVDQDLAEQKMQLDLRFTLSTILEHYSKRQLGIRHYLCLNVGLKYPLVSFSTLRIN